MFCILVKYNLLLLGGPYENSFSQQYLDRTALVQTHGNYLQMISLRLVLVFCVFSPLF